MTTELIVLLIAIPVVLLGAGFTFLRSRSSSRKADIRSQISDLKVEAGVPDRHPDVPNRDSDESQDLTEVEDAKPVSFFDRLALARNSMSSAVGSVFTKSVSSETWDSLEEALILSDVGISTTTSLVDELKVSAKEGGVTEAADLKEQLVASMIERLDADRDLAFASGDVTSVWMMVGVNGVGKTTTIGKIANQQVTNGKKVTLAAGDTFRAAAAEQLSMWADRSGADIVTGSEGGDPASVVFDAIESAVAKSSDLVLADTAGRLQNKSNLMDELSKISRVAEKASGKVTEVLLVIDATTGQNGLSQAKVFSEAVEVTGVVLTKLDGSAKGGIVFAIESELGIPVKLVGLGEGIDDLVRFEPDEFVRALVS